MTNRTYNCRANRALLRLYQMYPNRVNMDIISLILVKTLMVSPEPDFIQSVCLISAKHQTDIVKQLIELEAQLQKAQFSLFWEQSKRPEISSLLSKVPGFEDAIRNFITSALVRTYAKVETNVLATALNIQDTVTDYAATKGWQAEGNAYVFPVNIENSPRKKETTSTTTTMDSTLRANEVGLLLQTLGRTI